MHIWSCKWIDKALKRNQTIELTFSSKIIALHRGGVIYIDKSRSVFNLFILCFSSPQSIDRYFQFSYSKQMSKRFSFLESTGIFKKLFQVPEMALWFKEWGKVAQVFGLQPSSPQGSFLYQTLCLEVTYSLWTSNYRLVPQHIKW